MEPRRGASPDDDHLRGTVVVLENASKSLARLDGNGVIRDCRQRCDEFIVETLVVPLSVIVHYVFGYRCPQVSLTERYDAVETLSADGLYLMGRIFPRRRSDFGSWLEGGGAQRLHLSRAHVPPR